MLIVRSRRRQLLLGTTLPSRRRQLLLGTTLPRMLGREPGIAVSNDLRPTQDRALVALRQVAASDHLGNGRQVHTEDLGRILRANPLAHEGTVVRRGPSCMDSSTPPIDCLAVAQLEVEDIADTAAGGPAYRR
jgi:hypothetical protein